MKEYPWEPGLLTTFRQYITIRLGLTTLAFVRHFLGPRLEPQFQFGPIHFVPVILDAVLLLTFFVWRGPRRFLGRFFLPIALILAAVIQLLYLGRYRGALGPDEPVGALLGLLIFLLVPVILAAWQYRFRYVVVYSLGLATLPLVEVLTWSEPGQVDHFLLASIFVIHLAIYVFVGYIVSNLMRAQRAQRQELAEANRRLIHFALTAEQLSASRERNRLARELHDTLAHTLSGLAVQLDALASVWQPEAPRARQMLERALDTARDGLDETRRVLQALRAAPLDDLGLALALRSLAESVADRGGLALDLDVPESIDGLSTEEEQGIYRVAQEALANVVQHANAQQVWLSFRREDGHFVLEISDDGTGLSSRELNAEDGLGLKGMRERAELMGATLTVTGRPGGGTAVILTKDENDGPRSDL